MLKTGTKVVTGVKGIGKGIGKGAKTLDDFAKRMLKKGRFKGFKITRKGKWFQLYASVNPWVLLASGEIVEVKTKGGFKVGQKGEKFITSGYKNADGVLVDAGKEVDGILIGGTKKQSGFVKNLDVAKDASKETTEKALKKGDEMFKKLEDQIKNSTDKIARINNKGLYRNPMFRKNYFKFLKKNGVKLSKSAEKFLAIHHIVPNALRSNEAMMTLLRNIGRDIDEVMNAIALPKVDFKLLDDIIKNFDEGVDSIKNIDEFKKALNLGDDFDISELRNVLKELEEFRSSSLHEIGNFHKKYSSFVDRKMKYFTERFRFVKKSTDMNTASQKALMKNLESEAELFIQNIENGLKNGKIILK